MTLIKKSKIIKLILSNSIADVSIDYAFNYEDNKIIGSVAANIGDVNNNHIGSMSSADGIKFYSNLNFEDGLDIANIFTTIQADLKDIINNTESYL